MVARVAIVVIVLAASARAQPGKALDAPAQLREANAAATAGDWAKVARIVSPLLDAQLAPADLAEAHRLAGIASYLAGFEKVAENELLAYLLIDPEGHLDPSLYPPEVVTFFDGVRSHHEAEILRARSAKTPQRAFPWLSPIPIASQIQNRQYKKAIVIASVGAALFATESITFVVLHDNWCKNGNTSCDGPGHSTTDAKIVKVVNYTSGLLLAPLAVYAIVDGVVIYRRQHRRDSIHAFATPVSSGALVGFTATW